MRAIVESWIWDAFIRATSRSKSSRAHPETAHMVSTSCKDDVWRDKNALALLMHSISSKSFVNHCGVGVSFWDRNIERLGRLLEFRLICCACFGPFGGFRGPFSCEWPRQFLLIDSLWAPWEKLWQVFPLSSWSITRALKCSKPISSFFCLDKLTA